MNSYKSKGFLHKLYNDFGEYIPGFFKISIDKELYEEIKWGEFTTEERATIVHEYVHFLQDISTTRGVSNFNYLAQSLQLYLAKAVDMDKQINLPINLEKCNVENAYIQSELMSFYKGDDSQRKIHHVNDIKEEKEEAMDEVLGSLGIQLSSINIYYDDKKSPYIFGTDCIAESMAYLIEMNSFGGHKRKNELPYNSCELLCEKLCPDLLKRREILVAICELSLMHYHSGYMFWNILKHIQENNLDFQDVKDLEKYFDNRTGFLVGDLEECVQNSMISIDALYPKKMPGMNEVNTTVKSYMTKGYQLRKKEKCFIAHIAESKYPDEYFLRLMNYFGIPVLCDKKYQIFSGGYLYMMLVPLAVLNIFTCMENNKCLMYNFLLRK